MPTINMAFSNKHFLFLIMNTFSWLVPGISVFSYGVAAGVLTQMQHSEYWYILMGLGMMLVAAQGYFSAIYGITKSLNGYLSITIMVIVGEIIAIAINCKAKPGLSDAELDDFAAVYTSLIYHTVILFITLLLGYGVSVDVKAEETRQQARGAAANTTGVV